MSVNTTLTGLSTTASSNGPDGTVDPPSTLDDAIRYALSFIAQLRDGTISNVFTAYTTGGTSTAYTITPSPVITAYTAGQSFYLTFNATSGASPTLQINGIATPPNLVKQNADGTYSNIAAGDIPNNHRSRVTLLSATQALVEDLPPLSDKIQPITASVAASALTCTLNPTALDFRSATLGSGAVNTRAVATAISIVVPSGATLGTINATQSRIILLAIDSAGTIELAVVNIGGGLNLDETTLISTTAISAGATSGGVIYSTTARSNVPFRVVGYVESTQATAGTWATAPSTLQGAGGNALTAMSSIGYGQTWQNLTASRALSTNYVNTTGRPIMVHAFGTCNVDNNFTITITGVGVNGSVAYAATKGTYVTAIVPPGAIYAVSATGGALIAWNELR